MSTGVGGVFEEEGGGLGGDAFAAAGEAEPLGGGGFDRDSVDVYAEVISHILAHGFNVGRHFRELGDDGDVDVAYRISFLSDKADDVAKEHPRVGAFPAWVGVGEVTADVAEGGCAENGVGEGVQRDIGI